MQKQTEPNVKPKPANGRRNLGKEKASAMHLAKAIVIDRQNMIEAKSKNGAAAKAERLAKKAA